MNTRARSVVQGLIVRAVEGTLSLEELYEEWPDDAESDPFARILYDDIESAVEHHPLDQRRLLGIDLALIGLKATSEDLIKARQALLRSEDEPNAEAIQRLIASTSLPD